MESKRLKRVAEAYQQNLMEILQFEVREPRLSGVWITHVIFTPDLRLAKIYFNTHEGKLREDEVIKGFERSKSFLKRELAQRVQLKYAPDLRFYYDESEDVQHRLDEIFKKIEDERHAKSEEN